MGHNYIIVVLPETIIQILMIVLLLIGIYLGVWQLKNERRRGKAIESLESSAAKYNKACDRMFNEAE
ncbi:hypothetical protein WGM54_03660 [Paenibacillus polymyxa]|uniref:hypothetical protein n=1 Tax=Paenibacillus polymyxa TaxID=1406 RepID=UPI00307DC7B0